MNALSHEWIAREDCTEVEFVIVDDGSQYRTHELLGKVSKLQKQFKIIRFSINIGHQAAFLAGYELAQGDVIVSLDADLQNPPELISDILDKRNEGKKLQSLTIDLIYI